jgi:hypothetical protein
LGTVASSVGYFNRTFLTRQNIRTGHVLGDVDSKQVNAF